jgi:hypothetical protein
VKKRGRKTYGSEPKAIQGDKETALLNAESRVFLKKKIYENQKCAGRRKDRQNRNRG